MTGSTTRLAAIVLLGMLAMMGFVHQAHAAPEDPCAVPSAKETTVGFATARLGECAERRGRLLDARIHYRAALASLPQGGLRQHVIEGRARAVESKLARFRVLAGPGAPTAIEGTLQGERIAFGATVWALPGELTLTARAPGYLPRVLTTTLAAGGERVLVVDALEPIVVAPARTARGGTSPLRMTGVVLTFAGAASLGVAGATGWLAREDAKTARAECDDLQRCSTRGVDASREGKDLARISTATAIGGAAALVAGVTLFVIGAPSSRITVGALPSALVASGRF